MKKALFFLSLSVSAAFTAIANDDINEIIVEDDPYVGVTMDLSDFDPMVYLSNITNELNPSKHVQNIDRLITSLAQSKSAGKDLFKDGKKVVKYLPASTSFTVKRVLKTAVYKDNAPDEYTTYILEDVNGVSYAIPDFEMKDLSRVSLNSYEKGLVEQFNVQNNYARVVIYFTKPVLYKNKKAPYSEKDLNSVFDFFLDQLKDYKKDKVLLSKRNFRLSMNIPVDTLAFLISEYKSLYIEDIEIISMPKRIEEEDSYKRGEVRYKEKPLKQWYDR